MQLTPSAGVAGETAPRRIFDDAGDFVVCARAA
jgi:hypothetical protein